MRLEDPVIITSRLLPGVRCGDLEVSIEYSKNQEMKAGLDINIIWIVKEKAI